ncbi:chorion peroxidase-like isoform X2 [Homarus americanus]|uniref:chorion peroxidase-like isoform X2 n=1 Tax=Homarus americanus TaxID=6706 RepID=UPI001C4901A1|nr:chorion peroxidase-like isoform X2 [Homarus americanus]
MRWWSFLMVVAAFVALAAPKAEAAIEELPVARVIRQINFRPSGGSRPAGGRPAGGRPGGGSGGSGCVCNHVVFCAVDLDKISQSCTLPDGSPGACCPQNTLAALTPGPGQGDDKIFSAAQVAVRLPSFDISQMGNALSEGLTLRSRTQQIEQNLMQNSLFLPRDSPAAHHLRVFTVSPQAKAMNQRASAIYAASRGLMTNLNLPSQTAGFSLRTVQVGGTSLQDMCPQDPSCNSRSKYRTADGSCNNPNNPTWGMSNTPVQRILPPTYDDGVFAPRSKATDGSILPNVRQIVNQILIDLDKPDDIYTSSVMQWAQFLDHDFAHIPFPSLESGEGIQCCPEGQEVTGELRHPLCLPINVTGDPFYGPRGSNCMNFVRSMFAVGTGSSCTFGFAEQLNQLTHWIDASSVYGSTEDEQRALRTFNNGLLKTSGANLLPINPNQGGECEAMGRGALCFIAGDSRVNEQPGLTAIHTIWMRQHNKVAFELQNINPQWSDEAVFQEARRIIIAQIQHITYNEWLPIIVGDNFVRSFGLNVRRSGFSPDYNPNLNPNMNNEFSTAAFRFGHTLVQGTLRLFSSTGGVSTIKLRDHFNSPHLIELQGKLDDIVRSFTQLAIQKFDSFITQDLSNHLFQTPRFNFGMDLMSLNLHRGREHGIATYNDIRQVCGLPRATSFQDITDQIDGRIVAEMQKLYKSVDDIDFFVAGITERPVSGGLLGWTFLCVVGDQFARLKKGDRFFYDLGGQPGSFKEPQLQQIRESSWARVLCDNSNMQAVQPLAFRQTNSRFNEPVPCQSPSIPRPDWSFWRGESAGK